MTGSIPIRTTLALTITLTTLGLSRPLAASLGGDATSVESDRAKMQASLQITSKNGYEVHEMHAPNSVVVREFVSSSGRVFGVAWTGPTRPDMQQLLGPYFDQFIQSAQKQKAQMKSRGPLSINEGGLVVQMTGHARYFVGKAYVSQMLPTNVKAEDIQ